MEDCFLMITEVGIEGIASSGEMRKVFNMGFLEGAGVGWEESVYDLSHLVL